MQTRVRVVGGLAAASLSVVSAAAAAGAQSAQEEIIRRDFRRDVPVTLRPVDVQPARVYGFPVEVRADAEEARVETTCLISFDVEASGRVDRGSVSAECDDEAFAAQARGMAQEWTFEPLVVDGEAVPRRGEVREVRFRSPG
jgi:TonB family protein